MAARDMEAAQRALRRTDYEGDSSDEEELIILSTGSISASPERKVSANIPVTTSAVATFDPYSPTAQRAANALIDDAMSVHTVETVEEEYPNRHPSPTVTSSLVSGGAGYLEMEEAPSRYMESSEPITTSSGLMLTHRRYSPTANRRNFEASRDITTNLPGNTTSMRSGTRTTIKQRNGMETVFDKSDPLTRDSSIPFHSKQRQYFEVENGFLAWKAASDEDFHGNEKRRHSMPMLQARRFLSYVRIWMVMSAVFLIMATGVLLHAWGHDPMESGAAIEGSGSVSSTTTASVVNNGNGGNQQYMVGGTSLTTGGTKQIILVPMQGISDVSKRQQYGQQQQQHEQQQQHQQQQFGGYQHGQRRLQQASDQHQHQHRGIRHALMDLRQEFDNWVDHHGKKYNSSEEKEHRFRIWTENHQRTMEKNQLHGPCRLTKQPVFGSNHFKDLSPDEFKAKYLTGYNPPRQEELDRRELQKSPQSRKLGSPHYSGQTLKPGFHRVNMHESIKKRLLQDHGHRILKQEEQNPNGYTMRRANCDWYEVACILRWLWNEAGVQFGSVIGTMEPKYDAKTYPNAIDWRDYGVVTAVRAQGSCGACWAITAVETVESAHAISTGNLYDLSEAEIITCDTSCEMCNGGWPQNAFEWVMKYGGLPLYNSYPYDGDKLLAMSNAMGSEGSSSSRYSYYSWTKDSVEAFREQVCPAGDASKHGSDDYWKDGGKNDNYADYSDKGRYGNIKGYGYATDRCICYSDGSGCTCNKQNEQLAVANIASYGPAVVCVDAALWQDYSGGILTADIGCGSEFMDVNHCAQVVGYAYTDGSDGEGGNQGENHNEGSSSGKRSGYWILKNSWTGYWGMNGYAYIAMGENTCGILNDMTQAYL